MSKPKMSNAGLQYVTQSHNSDGLSMQLRDFRFFTRTPVAPAAALACFPRN